MKQQSAFSFYPIAHQVGNVVDDLLTKGLHDLFGGQMINSTIPSTNISEDDKTITLELAAPGLKKQDFKILFEKGVLTISASKEESKSEIAENVTRKEFNYATFKRSFQMPDHIDSNQFQATYENGILKISVPKKIEIKQEKQIEIL